MTPTRKLFIVVLVLLVIGAALYFGRSTLFQGKLVFFENGASSQQVVSASYVTYYDAVELLLNSAQSAGRITAAEAAATRAQVRAVPDHSVTRAEFAQLSVSVFKINAYGYGDALSDVTANHPASRDIYLFTSNGGLSSEFKPDNPATRSFAEKAAQSLSGRFKAQ